MKILHINCNYVGTRLHKIMIKHLDKTGIDNFVFAPVYNLPKENEENKKVVVSKCFKKYDRIFFDYKSKKIRRALLMNYDISEFNLIHAYTLFTDGNVAYELKKKYPKIKYVVAIRNTDVNTFLKYMLHLRKRGIKIMQEASAIFFLSETYKRVVFNKYVPKNIQEELDKKTYIIPNGIDDFWISNSYEVKNVKSNSKNVNIIYAGRIDKNKNIETTQKSLKILQDNGYITQFSIAGKIENKKIFNKIMSYENTKYYGEKNKVELMKLYRKNDIFVMPSFSETFGLVYVEAMSQGIPVIYTRGQGFDGQFEEGIVGYSVNPKSKSEIADKIKMILKKYEEISENCIKKYTEYNWDKICDKYYQIYQDILYERRKKSGE